LTPSRGGTPIDTNILGIHHITAIASDPQRNVDFYTGVLGLRLVKVTVNFDDPGSYHFYYGDALGRPGSVLTFFAWPGAEAYRGRRGTGQMTTTAFSVPAGSLGYWKDRLASHDVALRESPIRFADEALAFEDPDGVLLELVAHGANDADDAPWVTGPVPADRAIRGFHSAALSTAHPERTEHLLTETLGFRRIAEQGDRIRLAVGTGADGGPGRLVDVLHVPGARPGQIAVGSVHHIAWRTPDDAQQQAWRERIAGLGYGISPVMDRSYFHSIYFREPGGILFEIATDTPGFATDETPERLGTGLQLPPFLEPQRARIEQRLPPLRLPEAGVPSPEEQV
jgi:catechol 2,3-dioxygenase-like lactoylglutathione lyase family enzyme